MAVRSKTRSSAAKHPTRKGSQAQSLVNAARANGVPLWVLVGVKLIETGSGSGVNETSGAGAQGPFQFMPATASSMGLRDPNNFSEAADAAAKLLASNHKRYGSWNAALEAYNGGPGAVGKGYAYTENDVIGKLEEFGLHELADEARGRRTVGWSPLELSPLWRLFHGEAPLPKFPGEDLLPFGGSGGQALPEAVEGGVDFGPVLQASSAVTAFLSMLTDVQFWIRAGEAVGAFILIYLALKELI